MGEFLDLVDGHVHGALDAALDGHRVGACGNILKAFADDGLRE